MIKESIMEAKLLVIEEGVAYTLFLLKFTGDLGIKLQYPAEILSDNQAAIIVINKGRGSFKRTKHILNKYHWIQQYIDGGVIVLKHISTETNIADFFTKPLTGAIFWFFLHIIIRNSKYM
jgi:hypothetical protein